MKIKRIIKMTLGFIVLVLIVKCCCVIYEYKEEKQRLEQEPYFTEYKLSKYEMMILHRCFSIESTPKWRGWYDDGNLREEDWPDYSYYVLKATEDTEIVVTVINYKLFDERSEWNCEGWKKAEEYGINVDNRLTVEWVIEHPKESIEILNSMEFNGEEFSDWQRVLSQYEEITETSVEE